MAKSEKEKLKKTLANQREQIDSLKLKNNKLEEQIKEYGRYNTIAQYLIVKSICDLLNRGDIKTALSFCRCYYHSIKISEEDKAIVESMGYNHRQNNSLEVL
jgi:endonuclease III-like uncharacterized protein